MADLLIARIESVGSGANAHTRGKAIFYLEAWKDKPNRVERRSRLAQECERALVNGDWKPVGDLLRNLW